MMHFVPQRIYELFDRYGQSTQLLPYIRSVNELKTPKNYIKL